MEEHLKKLNEEIAKHSERGKSYLNEAKLTQENANTYYPLAIQEFVLAYKHALLLNGDHTTERSCLFNLGASYIAGGYSARGIDVLNNILKFTTDQDPGSHPRKGDILFNIALAYDKMKEYDNAIKYYHEALMQYRIEFTNFSPLLCETLVSLGKIYAIQKNFMQARAMFTEAADRFAQHEESAPACYALLHKVDTMIQDRGVINPECSKILEDCVEQAVKIKDADAQSKLLNEIGLKLTLVCEYENALKCFGAALRLCGNNSKHRRALTLQNMGAIYNRLKRFKMAIPLHNECIEIHGELSNRNAQGQCFCNLAFAQSQLRRYEAARESFQHALRAFKDTGDYSGQWQVYEGLAAVSILFAKTDQAILYYQQAISLQAQSKNNDPAAQDRLIRKLSYALSMRNQALDLDDDYHRGRIPEALPMEHPRPGSRRRQLLDRSSDVQPNRLRQIPTNINVTVEDGPTSPQPPFLPKSRKPADEPVVIPKKANESTSPENTPVKKPSPQKSYRRGRRDYDKNEDRPLHYVARGLSTLTRFSVQSADRFILEVDSEDGQEGDHWNGSSFALSDYSDEEEMLESVPSNIRYRGRVYSVSPATMSAVTRRIKNVSDSGKVWKKNGKKSRPTSANPRIAEIQANHSLFEDPSTSKTRDRRPKSASRRPKDPTTSMLSAEKSKTSKGIDAGLLSAPSDVESDSDRKGQDVSPRNDLNETDYAEEYRKQLENIDEQDNFNEDDESDAADSSSSTSDDESGNEGKQETMLPKSMPSGTPPKPPLQEPSISHQTYEKPLIKDESPLYATSSKKSLRFSPSTNLSGNSTHLYETLPTPKSSSGDQPGRSDVKDEEHVYDRVPSTLVPRSDSFSSHSSDVPPLSTLVQEDSAEPATSSKIAPPKPARRSRTANDTLPEPPAGGESSKKSKACSIM